MVNSNINVDRHNDNAVIQGESSYSNEDDYEEGLHEDNDAVETSANKGNYEEGYHEESSAVKISNEERLHEVNNAMISSNRKRTCENNTAIVNSKSRDENDNSSKNKMKRNRKSYWKHVTHEYSNVEKRRMVAECLSILCKIIMSHHVYNFGGKTFLQREHGCIGDEAIGVIAILVMIWWSNQFKTKLKELKMLNPLLKIYVDDVNGLFKSIAPGIEFKDGRLRYNEEKEKEDRKLPKDKVTMEVVKTVANSIDDMIQMTVDFPSKYEDDKVPMLDVKVWLNEKDENKIYYTFYEKPTKSPFVVSKSSAMPIAKKIECLGQEVFRRLHNMKRELDVEEKNKVLNDFMVKLKVSGYNEHDRYQILTSGLNAYRRLRT